MYVTKRPPPPRRAILCREKSKTPAPLRVFPLFACPWGVYSIINRKKTIDHAAMLLFRLMLILIGEFETQAGYTAMHCFDENNNECHDPVCRDCFALICCVWFCLTLNYFLVCFIFFFLGAVLLPRASVSPHMVGFFFLVFFKVFLWHVCFFVFLV